MTQQEQLEANAAAQTVIQKVANTMKARAIIYAAAQQSLATEAYLRELQQAQCDLAVG